MMRFKIMHGFHTGNDPADPKRDKMYKVGDIVVTDEDLRKLNGPGQSPKYLNLDGRDDNFNIPSNQCDPISDPPMELR
jgi:hypothetical protein